MSRVFEVEEIFTDILLRLPVKSLLACKSVCKQWRGLIGGAGFMNLHSQKHACLDGTVYWLGLSDWPEVDYILSVDAEEKFSTVRLPAEKTPLFKHIFLIDLEGRLSLVAVDGLDHQIRFD